MESRKKIIFSYQGAFGPPTLGHYQSMVLFTEMMIEHIEQEKCDIYMMFMPTASSGSKKHLEPTQDLRIKTLEIFCEKLREEFSDFPNFFFVASRLEYELYPITKSTGTIHTIKEIIGETTLTEKPDYLKSFSRDNDELILGMGADNMYQLPYWADVEKYKDMVNKIFIVQRPPSDEDRVNLGQFNLNEKTFLLQKTIPWNFKLSKLKSILESEIEILKEYIIIDDSEDIKIKKGFDLSTVIDGIIKLKIELPDILVSKIIPMPTSSSMMRYFLSIYVDKYFDIIKNLMFGSREIDDIERDIILETVAFYKGFFESNPKPENKNYDLIYEDMFPQIGKKDPMKGGKKYFIEYSI